MPIDLIFSPDRSSNNPFEVARRKLVAELARLKVPSPLDVCPLPGQFNEVKDHVCAFSDAFDRWIRDVGAEAAANSYCAIEPDLFDTPYRDAIEGMATFALEVAEDAARRERRELVA